MKLRRMISLLLAVLLTLVCFVSCGSEEVISSEKMDALKNHVYGLADHQMIQTYGNSVVWFEVSEVEGTKYLFVCGATRDSAGYTYQLLFYPDFADGDGNFELVCKVMDSENVLLNGKANIHADTYLNTSAVKFVSFSGSALNRITCEQVFTELMNETLNGVQALMNQIPDEYALTDLGFSHFVVNESVKPADTEEDLGGILSGARWAYAGRMTLLGVCTVFAVLTLLWGVLVLFKVFMYDLPNKKAAQNDNQSAPEKIPEPQIAPAADETQDDGTLIAVITAAIAAAIDADPQLTGKYGQGFRVVSFKRK